MSGKRGSVGRIEAQILGECQLDASVIDYLVSRGLTAEHFGSDRHRLIWNLFTTRHTKGLPIDTIGIVDAFYEDNNMDNGVAAWEPYGGLEYVLNLHRWTPCALRIDTYVTALNDALLRRRVKKVLLSGAHEITSPAETADVRETVLAGLTGLTGRANGAPQSPAEISASVCHDLDREADGSRQQRLPSGLAAVDETLDGISTDGVTLLLAMSGHGKSSVVYRLALGMALAGIPVYLHATERRVKQVHRVLAHALACVSQEQLRFLRRSDDPQDHHRLRSKVEAVQQAAKRIATLPLTMTGSGWSVERVAAYGRVLASMGRAGIVMVDYLQDLSPSAGLKPDPMTQTSHKSRVLKDLAAEVEIPVLITAQVSGEKQQPQNTRQRGGEAQVFNPRPKVHSCQWSSQVHQDAEEVWGLFNPAAYRDKNPGVNITGVDAEIEFDTLKRRDGGHRQFGVRFHGPTRWVGENL